MFHHTSLLYKSDTSFFARHVYCLTVGGTNTNDALLRSIDFLVRQEESDPLAIRVSMILLITSSNPTVGISDPVRILSNVRQASGARVSVNVFVPSADVGRPFLDHLAQQNRGALHRCCEVGTDGLVDELRDFYRETSSPLLENIRFRYNDAVDEATLTTLDYPAYFEGCELVVVGRLRRAVTHLAVKVSGGSTQVNASVTGRCTQVNTDAMLQLQVGARDRRTRPLHSN